MDTVNRSNTNRKTTDMMRTTAAAGRQSKEATLKADRPRSPKPRLINVVIAIVVIALIVAGGYLFMTRHKLAGVDSSKYQALFLTNGQVYFGKLSQANSGTVEMHDIYYMQVQQKIQPSDTSKSSATDNTNTSLIKLGQELHGPEDQMYVPKSQILFWENLKPDGKVAKAIEAYQKKQ